MNNSIAVRRRDAAATRAAILQCGRRRFQRETYEQVGVRAIAADAGVDPALISRYFGSKEGLLAEVLESTSQDPMEVLGGDRDSFGQRVARALLDPSERTDDCIDFIQVATRASGSPTATRLVRRHIEKQFTAPFIQWLGGKRAAEKAWLVACVLTGTSVMTAIDGPAESTAIAKAIDQLGTLLQAIIDDL